MVTPLNNGTYATLAERAVSSYLRLMSDFQPVSVQGESAVDEHAQRDLHSFFATLYSDIAAHPELFGLPATPDVYIAQVERNEKERKQEVKRLLDKPKRMIEAGLDFLMLAGIQGKLNGASLMLEGFPALLKQSGVKPRFVAGLESSGLALALADDTATMTHARFAAMMPALRAMATRCAALPDKSLGRTMFAVCDLRALSGDRPHAMDLYGIFSEPDRQRVAELHSYFCDHGYKTEIELHAPGHWVVKYQGDRAIKATPLYQVGYDDRHERPMEMQIKCASTGRLAAVLPAQSQLLRDDFTRRVYPCRGDACGWCKTQKTLGPTVLDLNGKTQKVCWYTYPEVHTLNDDTVELIRQYEQMHMQLATVGGQ